MARRRMFSTELLASDPFLDLELATQMLYIQLNMRADDEGFVSSAKGVCRLCGCSERDVEALAQAGFLIRFDSGVVVITDWLVNNTIRKDRSVPTMHREERSRLAVQNGRYVFAEEVCQPDDNQLTTTCQPFDDHLATQNRIDKNRIDKNRLDQNRSDQSVGCPEDRPAPEEEAYEEYEVPDMRKLYEYQKEHNLNDVNFVTFWLHYDANGWCDDHGEPIRDWRAMLRKWNEAPPDI